MELRQLKYFVTVAKTLNFSEASKLLFITQGTLSQQIKQLEDELGSELFVRSSHKVSLTEAGAEMLPLAQHALKDSDECFQRISDLRKGVSGTLTIGLTTSFRDILNNALKLYLKQYPNVKLQIVYSSIGELHEMLNDHEIDFFIAFKPAVMYDEIETRPFLNSELCAVMNKNHPLADRKSLTLQDLQRQRIILPSSGLQSRKAFDRFVDADTSSLNICVEINNPHGIIRLVQTTNLIAIVSSLATYYDPSLVAIPIEEMRRTMVGCVHTLKDCYIKKSARLFIETLEQTL